MTWRERWRLLPPDSRISLRNATLWLTLAAVLDAVCGLLLLTLLQAWWGQQHFPWIWILSLLGVTVVHSVVLYQAHCKGYLAGVGLLAGVLAQLLVHLPGVSAPALSRIASPEGLLRGPIPQSMAIPAHLLAPVVSAVVTPTCVVLGLLLVDPRIAMALSLAGCVLALLLRWAARCSVDLEEERTAAEQAVTGQIQRFSEHQILLRAAGRGGPAQLILTAALAELRQRSHSTLKRGLPAALVFSFAVQAIFALAVLMGAAAVVNGAFDAALLVALLVLLVRFMEPLEQLTHLSQALRGALRALDVLLEIFALAPLPSPLSGPPIVDASVQALQLGYQAHNGTQLLTDIELNVPAGSLTALVGPSGAGKTSLLGLLARLFDPSDGRVLLGQVDARDLDKETLAETRSMMFQAQGVVGGSVSWNLRMADPRAELQDLREAAAGASLLGDIESWPTGWETDVGPNGALLSGGQRQRLNLARCLLSKAPILMLDEPTASLDAISQAHVHQTFGALHGLRTVIVVTHDPALARLADQIVVLSDGRIRACGGHENLRIDDAWYATFCSRRFEECKDR